MVAVDAPAPACDGKTWCHLFADTLDELHAAARMLGLKRSWFQCQPTGRHPHYDLTGGVLAKAQALYPRITGRAKFEMLVCDPCMGMGTTAVVAERLNLQWLGCELNPEYAAYAEQRIAQAREQTSLLSEVAQ